MSMVLSTALRLSAWVLLSGLGGSAVAATNLYCCIDAVGKQVCADLLPPACYGRAYRELGDSGRTVRVVDAPLTVEQRAQRTAEEAQQKAKDAVRRENQRKDQALLNTYGSENDIEMMRSRALDDVQKSISAAEAKITELRTKRTRFENESEFYKKKQLPPEVQKGLRDVDNEITAQQQTIEARKHDLDLVRAKYDEDKRRYLDLSRRSAAPR
jgi:hypothetical protein